MFEAIRDVNWFAVALANITAFLVGGIWFMLLFKRTYAIALGRETASPKPSAISLAGPFLCQTVTIITTAVLLRALGVTSYAGAVQLGVLVGIGYLVPMTVNIALNPNFPRPFLYSLMNGPFFVLTSLTSCVILVAMS